MIKPKYPKRADISQIARSIVEHATGAPLTPRDGDTVLVSQEREKHHKKHRKTTSETDK